MPAFLERELLTVAFCWRLERRDGVALGFTTHDRDIRRGGLIYRAAPGMLPSSISITDGFDAESLDMEGALTSAAISAADLSAGRWDGASVHVFMVDWGTPDGRHSRRRARRAAGEVSIKAGAFEAELRSAIAQLDAPVAEQTSPGCRAQLGDKRCRVDMAGRTRLTRIAAAPAEDVVEVAEAGAGDDYGFGRLRWLGGPNSGLESEVLRSAGAVLTLAEPPAFPPALGDLVEISEGCDRILATCAGRFANAANFRASPICPASIC